MLRKVIAVRYCVHITIYFNPFTGFTETSQHHLELGLSVISQPDVLVVLAGCLISVDLHAVQHVQQDPLMPMLAHGHKPID
jgi:hypothetical protein